MKIKIAISILCDYHNLDLETIRKYLKMILFLEKKYGLSLLISIIQYITL